jgi:hypothetical protein
MSAIIFESDVTEYEIFPPKDNDVIHFCIFEKSLVINFMNTN